ncbi:hypothetical protein E2C01_006994 [Portunus trituberculatus]|uniref:Uncharacterized protein n=1 Tax=Portunus trituberculatus TaxID=210409 RepID=A0A5B7CZM8_PORTR|nr:hypothetical protein [Portunus trituberculatus]
MYCAYSDFIGRQSVVVVEVVVEVVVGELPTRGEVSRHLSLSFGSDLHGDWQLSLATAASDVTRLSCLPVIHTHLPVPPSVPHSLFLHPTPPPASNTSSTLLLEVF